MLLVPDCSVGANGSVLSDWSPGGFGHGVVCGPLAVWACGPEVIGKLEVASVAGVADHGASTASVVYVPHNAGVTSGARSVPKNSNFRSLNGNAGVFSNVETICPVTGLGTAFPATFTNTPAIGSSATKYIDTRLLKGFSCSAPANVKFCGA